MKFFQIAGAAVVGFYLALIPLIQPLFVVHNSKCVCHQPLRLLEARLARVYEAIGNAPEANHE